MPAVAAGVAIVGAGIAIYGDIQSANDQSQLDAEKASVANQQAAEIAARNQQNAAIQNQVAFRQKMQFGSSYAASGKAGVGIGSQLQIQNQTDLQNMVQTREANFQEMMLKEQAGIDTTMGNNIQQALPWEVAGAAVQGLGSAARTPGAVNTNGPTGQGLGSVGGGS